MSYYEPFTFRDRIVPGKLFDVQTTGVIHPRPPLVVCSGCGKTHDPRTTCTPRTDGFTMPAIVMEEGMFCETQWGVLEWPGWKEKGPKPDEEYTCDVCKALGHHDKQYCAYEIYTSDEKEVHMADSVTTLPCFNCWKLGHRRWDCKEEGLSVAQSEELRVKLGFPMLPAWRVWLMKGGIYPYEERELGFDSTKILTSIATGDQCYNRRIEYYEGMNVLLHKPQNKGRYEIRLFETPAGLINAWIDEPDLSLPPAQHDHIRAEMDRKQACGELKLGGSMVEIARNLSQCDPDGIKLRRHKKEIVRGWQRHVTPCVNCWKTTRHNSSQCPEERRSLLEREIQRFMMRKPLYLFWYEVLLENHIEPLWKDDPAFGCCFNCWTENSPHSTENCPLQAQPVDVRNDIRHHMEVDIGRAWVANMICELTRGGSPRLQRIVSMYKQTHLDLWPNMAFYDVLQANTTFDNTETKYVQEADDQRELLMQSNNDLVDSPFPFKGWCFNCWERKGHRADCCPYPRLTIKGREQLRVMNGVELTPAWKVQLERHKLKRADTCTNCFEKDAKHCTRDCPMSPGTIEECEHLRIRNGAKLTVFWKRRLQSQGLKPEKKNWVRFKYAPDRADKKGFYGFGWQRKVSAPDKDGMSPVAYESDNDDVSSTIAENGDNPTPPKVAIQKTPTVVNAAVVVKAPVVVKTPVVDKAPVQTPEIPTELPFCCNCLKRGHTSNNCKAPLVPFIERRQALLKRLKKQLPESAFESIKPRVERDDDLCCNCWTFGIIHNTDECPNPKLPLIVSERIRFGIGAPITTEWRETLAAAGLKPREPEPTESQPKEPQPKETPAKEPQSDVFCENCCEIGHGFRNCTHERYTNAQREEFRYLAGMTFTPRWRERLDRLGIRTMDERDPKNSNYREPIKPIATEYKDDERFLDIEPVSTAECWNCWGEGHVRRECTDHRRSFPEVEERRESLGVGIPKEKEYALILSYVRCFNCWKLGHEIENCPANLNSIELRERIRQDWEIPMNKDWERILNASAVIDLVEEGGPSKAQATKAAAAKATISTVELVSVEDAPVKDAPVTKTKVKAGRRKPVSGIIDLTDIIQPKVVLSKVATPPSGVVDISEDIKSKAEPSTVVAAPVEEEPPALVAAPVEEEPPALVAAPVEVIQPTVIAPSVEVTIPDDDVTPAVVKESQVIESEKTATPVIHMVDELQVYLDDLTDDNETEEILKHAAAMVFENNNATEEIKAAVRTEMTGKTGSEVTVDDIGDEYLIMLSTSAEDNEELLIDASEEPNHGVEIKQAQDVPSIIAHVLVKYDNTMVKSVVRHDLLELVIQPTESSLDAQIKATSTILSAQLTDAEDTTESVLDSGLCLIDPIEEGEVVSTPTIDANDSNPEDMFFLSLATEEKYFSLVPEERPWTPELETVFGPFQNPASPVPNVMDMDIAMDDTSSISSAGLSTEGSLKVEKTTDGPPLIDFSEPADVCEAVWTPDLETELGPSLNPASPVADLMDLDIAIDVTSSVPSADPNDNSIKTDQTTDGPRLVGFSEEADEHIKSNVDVPTPQISETLRREDSAAAEETNLASDNNAQKTSVSQDIAEGSASSGMMTAIQDQRQDLLSLPQYAEEVVITGNLKIDVKNILRKSLFGKRRLTMTSKLSGLVIRAYLLEIAQESISLLTRGRGKGIDWEQPEGLKGGTRAKLPLKQIYFETVTQPNGRTDKQPRWDPDLMSFEEGLRTEHGFWRLDDECFVKERFSLGRFGKVVDEDTTTEPICGFIINQASWRCTRDEIHFVTKQVSARFSEAIRDTSNQFAEIFNVEETVSCVLPGLWFEDRYEPDHLRVWAKRWAEDEECRLADGDLVTLEEEFWKPEKQYEVYIKREPGLETEDGENDVNLFPGPPPAVLDYLVHEQHKEAKKFFNQEKVEQMCQEYEYMQLLENSVAFHANENDEEAVEEGSLATAPPLPDNPEPNDFTDATEDASDQPENPIGTSLSMENQK